MRQPGRISEGAHIRIQLDIEEVDPPVGTARLDGGGPRPFAGWLGMLEVVSVLVADAAGSLEADLQDRPGPAGPSPLSPGAGDLSGPGG